jgi:hypothetical protein
MPSDWRGRRLHNADGPAVDSDIEPLYFWHGILVPSFVILRPDLITVAHIHAEDNAEVRRVMLERMGFERYVEESGAERVQADDYGDLFRIARPDDSDLVVVRVVNSTPEPDGSFKRYTLRVPPAIETAREAVAWSFGKSRAEDYQPMVQT